ncbi:MAG: hypothetical protein HYS06_04840 [Methylocystis sp.]|nr:hypothetical protein [Methylocystis sp.]MBI3274739.1 hypothetical protein [Methylocystis sp.]
MQTYLQRLRDGYTKNGMDPKVRRDSFDDFLTMKTIGTKRVWTFGNPLGANASPVCMGGHSRELVRNLCVRVDALTLAELDAVTDVLDCSKQEFVVEALSAAIAKAMHGIDEQGLAHLFDERIKDRLEKAELSFQPSADGSHEWLYFRGELMKNKEWERHKGVVEGVKQLIEGEKAQSK